MDKLKSCIVGLGQVGLQFDLDEKRNSKKEIWTHFRAYEELSNLFELTTVVDPRKSTHNLALLRNPKLKCFSSIEDLLKSKVTVDFVSVCTPDHLHCSSLTSLIPEVRGVFMEKPLTDDISQLRKIEKFIPKYFGKKSIKINYYKRYEPSVLFVKNDILNHEIKHVVCIYTGPFFAVGTHAIDLILQFVNINKILSVFKHSRSKEGNGYSVNFIGKKDETINLVNANYREKFIFELNIITNIARYNLTDNLEKVTIKKIRASKKYSNYFEYTDDTYKKFLNKTRFKCLMEESYEEITNNKFDYFNLTSSIKTQKLMNEIERF